MPTELGQNFLVNKSIAQRIVGAARLNADDFVLEIGPGKGILTEELAKKAGKVLAIEIDKVLSNLLLNKFSNRKNVEIINRDILKIDLRQLISNFPASPAGRQFPISNKIPKSKNPNYELPITDYKIVANLPYYITSPIIRMFLESDCPPVEMILMVQKEVAERICASPREIPADSRSAKRISLDRPGKMSILSVAVQYYAKPEILFYVGKENFDPVPEVESAIIKIVPYSSSPYLGRGIKGEGENTKKFFRVVKSGFCAKRKTLANNLANSFHLDKKETEEKIISAGLDKNVRAQELSINDWKILVKLF